MSAVSKGSRGENEVLVYLFKKSFVLLEKNYRVRGGEIDIICKQGDVLCFVEVKTRKDVGGKSPFGSPGQAVDYKKIKRITAAAQRYLDQKSPEYSSARFDVAEVYTDSDGDVRINYIENAFEAIY